MNGISCITWKPLSKDAKIISILSPPETLPCGSGGTYNVSLVYGSGGSDTLFNLAISYFFDGTWVSETIDTLLPFDVDTFVFSSTIDITTPGNYQFIAAIYDANDEYPDNDTLETTIILMNLYSTFPYLDDYEGAIEWSTVSSNTSFELATPSSANINGAYSGNYSWVTNATGNYNNNENGFVESPCFDFSTLDTPIVEMAINYNTESCCDGAFVQVSLDTGNSWITILPGSVSENWYSSSSGWRGSSGGWIVSKTTLDTLGGEPSVKFRVYFTSDGSVNSYDGFAFDNFLIYDKPKKDAKIISILSPPETLPCGSGGTYNVSLVYGSGGSDTLFNLAISYFFDGTWVSETIDTLLPFDVDTFVFSSTIDITTPGNYQFIAAIYDANDEYPDNDTLETTIILMNLYSTFPYLDDYEGAIEWSTVSSNTSFELATPSSANINGAYSGNYSWVTNATGNYNNNENGFVESPCFDFSTLDTPIVEMAINYNTESCCDGAFVQVSLDTGNSWITILPGSVSENWYSSSSGWRGSSGGWIVSKTTLDTLGGEPSVKFRVYFTSDGSVNSYDGFAFDNFLIYDKPENDLRPVALLAPDSVICCGNSNEAITISIENAGTMPQDTFDVSVSIDGGTNWTTETYNDTILSGEIITYTFSQLFDFSAPDTYEIIIAVSNDGDEIQQNDTIYSTVVVSSPVTTIPLIEDFETFSTTPAPGILNNNWTASPFNTSSYSWRVQSGSTLSSSTGPDGDHTTGSGIYLYTEASNGSQGDEAVLLSPCFNFSGAGLIRFSFWYHMYGAAINTLYIEIMTPSHTWITIDSLVGQQQTASGDPWLKKEYVLPDTTCQIRFRAIRGNSYTGDIAIDDIRIENVPNYDLILSSIERPVSGCEHTSTDTVTVMVINGGLQDITSFTLAFSLDTGNTWVTETYTGLLSSLDTLIYDFSNTVDLSDTGEYYLMVYVSEANDTVNYNDTLGVSLYYFDMQLPYTENFETFSTTPAPGVLDNNWTAYPFNTSSYSWDVNSGSTTSSSTGPDGDHTTGSGIYLYTEASNGNQGDEAILTSPCIDASSIVGTAFVSFWYHMYGATIDRLYLEYLNASDEWVIADSIVGQQQTTSTEEWKNKIAFVPASELKKIRFRAIRGSSYTGDIAIDDIFIGQAIDTNLAAISIEGPAPSCSMGSNEQISMTVLNLGGDTINTFYLSYSIDTGNTWVSEQVSQQLGPGQAFTYTFSTGADFSQAGEYLLMGVVGVLNDTINSDDTAYTTVIHIPTIDTFEYLVDFENGTNFWSTGGTGAWEFGTPSSVVPYSGNSCWGTNLDGNYNNNEEAYLYTPCFDFSTLPLPEMQFAINYNTESCCDEVYVEYSTDGGATWQMLGSNADSAWYNDGDGFVGSSNGWVLAYHDLSFLGGEPQVKFRFVFSSDGSVTYDGVYIDDFRIYQTVLPDLAVVYPENGGTVSICSGLKNPVISVKNVGTILVGSGTSFDINYQINNGTLHTQTITLSSDLIPGDSIVEVFNDVYYFANNQTYDYKMYISFVNDDYSNDTVVGNYIVQDLIIDLGPDTIWTDQPDTVVLTPGSGYVSYLWNTGDTTNTLNVDTFGVFNVTVTDMYGCEASDSVVVELLIVGDEFVNIDNNLEVYPNPNNGTFNVEYLGNAYLSIISPTGKVVYEGLLNNKKEVDVRKYGTGIYVLKLRDEKNVLIRKVVVK